MHTKYGITEKQKENLLKLAAYLEGPLLAEFDMKDYSKVSIGTTDDKINCGTCGCAAGHGPYAGIPKDCGESWNEYCLRVFGVGYRQEKTWMVHGFIFGASWKRINNEARSAAKRIRYFLENGVPDIGLLGNRHDNGLKLHLR